MAYEILPHTGDLRVRLTGKTKAGLFQSALKGMFAAAGPRYVNDVEPENRVIQERHFSVEGASAVDILVNLLNEAISLSDIHHESYEDIKFSLVTDAKAEGYFVDRAVRGFDTQIKAATHHNLSLQKREDTGEWEATVTFDV